MPFAALERIHPQVVEAVAARIVKRSASAFRLAGSESCREFAEMGLSALRQDLASGGTEAVRAHAYALVDGLGDKDLSFSDLRFYAQTSRKEIRLALEGDPEADDIRVAIEGWFFELLLVCTMRFMAWRDEVLQRESAKIAVERLESQLVDLEVALAEKTQLLELIRQTSTPIAPVVRGILVVPLIGTFDSFRAELLTEKLLNEISQARSRAVILDISGVPVFDTEAAQLIIRLARSVRMLGTEAFLVGLSPDNATMIVELGIDLTGIQTLATLQDGLARALSLQRLKIAPL